VTSKYRNTPCGEDGYRFDSLAERARYQQLKLLVAAGQIRQLEVHPAFPLVVNGRTVCRYEADFAYFDEAEQRRTVEDVKGARTALFRLKARLLHACHGIVVQEIPARDLRGTA